MYLFISFYDTYKEKKKKNNFITLAQFHKKTGASLW